MPFMRGVPDNQKKKKSREEHELYLGMDETFQQLLGCEIQYLKLLARPLKL